MITFFAVRSHFYKDVLDLKWSEKAEGQANQALTGDLGVCVALPWLPPGPFGVGCVCNMTAWL